MNDDDKLDLALALLDKYLETKSTAAIEKFWMLYPKPIPAWHLPMMNDKSRNDFYESEIQAKAKGKIVLDIGTGAGLLTQYALDAGAIHVYSLELDPVLQRCFAHTFKEEIKSGRVTLLAKKSQDLVVEDFIKGEPELVVHEIFGNALLNERVVETFADLFERKILPTSLEFIPQKFSLWANLHTRPFQNKILDPRYTDKFWFLENISYFGSSLVLSDGSKIDSEDQSESFKLFEFDLKNLIANFDVEIETLAKAEGNILRVWFKLHGHNSIISTDAKVNSTTHWTNVNYHLPFSKGANTVKATYKKGKFLTFLKR